MRCHTHRLRRLEARQHRRHAPVQHFINVVRYPWDQDVPDVPQRLRCPELRVGLLVPETAPDEATWAARRRDG